MAFNKATRQIVFNKYEGRCAYCGKILTEKRMNIDHIKPKVMGGTDNIENLNPSCWECNNYKCHSSLETMREYLLKMVNELPHERLFKSKTKMQVAINIGSVVINKWDGIFYFERINKPKIIIE